MSNLKENLEYIQETVEYAKSRNLYTPKEAERIVAYAENAFNLIGQRVSVHTNRNQHVWSLKSVDAKHTLLAYALDRVLLSDVCWTQPSVSAARTTFHGEKGTGGDRTVQAFAEGRLESFDLNFDISMFQLETPAKLLATPTHLMYRPKPIPQYVGAFRDIENPNIGIAASDFGILEYMKSLGDNTKVPGSRGVKCIAFGEIESIPKQHLSDYVNAIVSPQRLKPSPRPYVSPNCRTYRSRK